MRLDEINKDIIILRWQTIFCHSAISLEASNTQQRKKESKLKTFDWLEYSPLSPTQFEAHGVWYQHVLSTVITCLQSPASKYWTCINTGPAPEMLNWSPDAVSHVNIGVDVIREQELSWTVSDVTTQPDTDVHLGAPVRC